MDIFKHTRTNMNKDDAWSYRDIGDAKLCGRKKSNKVLRSQPDRMTVKNRIRQVADGDYEDIDF